MAAVDIHLPSASALEAATKTVERWAQSEPTEEEKLEFLRKAINAIGMPENVKVFRDAMTELAVRAVLTDNAFARVKNTMDAFVREHGDRFPGIKPFQSEWNGYRLSWSTYITTSRDFAIQTAAEYDDYTLQLGLVNNIKTKEDMDALAKDLTEFSKNHPVGIPINFKDKFLDLKRDVEYFQERFNKYLDEQGAQLTARAKQLKDQIDSVEAEIKGLDKQIKDATLGLEIASWWGPLGAAIAGTALGILCIKRANKQKDLDGLRDDLRKVEADQQALAEIKAQFAGLVPDFKLLSENLGLFADTWNAFHNEAEDFAAKFLKVTSPAALTELYKARIKLALAVSVPLAQALRDYAAKIHL